MPDDRSPAWSVALAPVWDRLARNLEAFGLQFPTVGDGPRYTLTENTHWLSGFWTGLLWLAYAATDDPRFRQRAEELLPSFRRRLDERFHITHDLGFLFTLSARAQWQFTGDDAARDLALRAAHDLAERFHPQGQYLQAWGAIGDPDDGGRLIIDTLMNLPLLFWAAQQSGDQRLAAIADQHADTAQRLLVRPDSSTYHTYLLDQATGTPLGPRTHQGYADDSLWARGQAWAIFGFAVAGAWTGRADYVATAERAAWRFLAELPASGVPWWDLRLPADAPHYPDTSAGTIAAAGLLRLARLVPAPRANALRQAAETLLQTLADHCLETEPDAQGLLRGGTYHAHKGWGVDSFFICGDYFWVEALLLQRGTCPDWWGPAAE